MAVEESQQFCQQCQRLVLARRPGTNHVFHLLMCVFTCGLWAIFWFLSSAKVGGWRCSHCGGTQLGAPGGAVAQAKSVTGRGLVLVGAGIGVFLGLVLLIATCSALRKSSSADLAQQAAIAEAEQLARAKAETAAKRAARFLPGEWTPGNDVAELGDIREGRKAAIGVDKTGDNLEIHNHRVYGWKMATFARYKTTPGAWKLSVESGYGQDCKPEHWAPRVTLIEDEGDRPMSAQWYRLDGGPLSGLVVKGFTKSSDCAFHFATSEYARIQGWKHTH